MRGDVTSHSGPNDPCARCNRVTRGSNSSYTLIEKELFDWGGLEYYQLSLSHNVSS